MLRRQRAGSRQRPEAAPRGADATPLAGAVPGAPGGQNKGPRPWRRLAVSQKVFMLGIILFAVAAFLARGGQAAGAEAISWKGSGKKGAVAAGGKGAVAAGLSVLKSGGNAPDAAVATILALSVTDSRAFCFGGEVPILVYDAKRDVVEVLCGLGTAPRLATRAHFAKKKDRIPGKGVEAAAVPGVLDACLTCLDRYGTKTFAEVAQP